MPPRKGSTKSEFPSMNTRFLRIQGESELWLNAMESVFLKPNTRIKTKARNTLLRA